ncbi:MAG TPA: hypothetical protein VME46_05750, partial [Acidimicrobiales bacterium]|nr:hypothetical protein [Acidimicrobiales bacterium]
MHLSGPWHAGRARYWRRVVLAAASALFVVGTPSTGGTAAATSVEGSTPQTAVAPVPSRLRQVTACQVFTLAEAQSLIGPNAAEDPSANHTVDFDGQRNSQCSYTSGPSGLADAQLLVPLTHQAAQALKTAFAREKASFEGTSLPGVGAAAFWKSKVGTPAIYVLTANDVLFNIGATTNGTNSASEAALERVAEMMVAALAGSGTTAPANGRPPQPPQLPAPPDRAGCYRYDRASSWQRMTCVAAAYVKEHFGIPLLGTPGIQQGRKGPKGSLVRVGPPIALSQLDAFPLTPATAETDTTHGAGAYSLQDNTNEFLGTNASVDWVQFVYQTTDMGRSGVACIWQISDVLSPQNIG